MLERVTCFQSEVSDIIHVFNLKCMCYLMSGMSSTWSAVSTTATRHVINLKCMCYIGCMACLQPKVSVWVLTRNTCSGLEKSISYWMWLSNVLVSCYVEDGTCLQFEVYVIFSLCRFWQWLWWYLGCGWALVMMMLAENLSLCPC